MTSSSLSTSLTLLEQHAIAKVLRQPPTSLQMLYYSATALTAIDKEVREPQTVCAYAKDNLIKDSAESLLMYSTIVKISTCTDVADVDVGALITDDTEPLALAQLITAMANLNIKVEDAHVAKLVAAAKENDSPKLAGALFKAASVLPKDTAGIENIVSMVEDIVAQADEVDGEHLQFEGGLSVTADVVEGICALTDTQGTALLKEEQALKFAQYFLKRKYVASVEDLHHLLVGLGGLAKNKHVVPVVVSVFQSSTISTQSPTLKVRVTNLIDQSIPEVSVTATSFESADSDATVVFENKPLAPSADQDDFIVIDSEVARGFVAANAFKLDVMAQTPNRGLYNCKLAVQLKEGGDRFVLDGAFTVKVKVLAKIMVEGVQIGVGDRDQTNINKLNSLTFPQKVAKVLEADYHQKLVMTFNLKDIEKDELVTVHQTFVRLVHETTGQEIFFVAEADSSEQYKFTLDVGTTGKDSFNNLSGKYRITLIVGDRAMQVPIAWTLGDIVLTFKGDRKPTKREARVTEARPTIEHQFRVPEKRPSKLVSTAFTVLVSSSILVMFAMWIKIGANVSNLQLNLSTLLFHVGLAGIFVLYYMFWVRLDMFVTLKLLVVVGGCTFLAGNRMLANMALQRTNK